jgi:hypothetical protein
METRNWEHIFNFSSGRELRYSLCSSSPAWWRKREIVFFFLFLRICKSELTSIL